MSGAITYLFILLDSAKVTKFHSENPNPYHFGICFDTLDISASWTQRAYWKFCFCYRVNIKSAPQLARACIVPVGQRSGGRVATLLVTTLNIIIFTHLFPQKTYLAKVEGSAQKPRGWHLSRPCWTFWGAILDFAGRAAFQAVRECPWRR